MYIPYRGYRVTINHEKWQAMSVREKVECICSYFCEQSAYIKKRLKDYWCGWVNVHVQDIGNTGVKPDPVYEVSIYAGRRGSGQTFSCVSKEVCQQIVDQWENSSKKQFELYLGNGSISQSYVFNRYQRTLLIELLKPVLERQWYEETEEWW